MSAYAWLGWGTLVTVAALSVTNPLYLGVAFLSVALVGAAAPRTETASSLRPILAVGVAVLAFSTVVAFVNGSPGEHVLFTVPGPDAPSWLGGLRLGGPVTAEGAVAAATRALAILCIFGAFAVITTSVSPAGLLRTAPAALFQAGLVITIGLTLVPATLADLQRLRESQALRGREPRWWRIPALVTPAILGGMERAVRLAEALEARGYAAGEPIPRLAWLAGSSSAPLLLAAAYLHLSSTGPAVLAIGIGAAAGAGFLAWVVSSARCQRRTRLHPARVSAPEGVAMAASAGLGLALVFGAAEMAYDPFRGFAVPTFTAAGAVVVLALAWPLALLLGNAAGRARRLEVAP